ncbi:MAG: glycogen synthase [Methylococcaceae bacterium]
MVRKKSSKDKTKTAPGKSIASSTKPSQKVATEDKTTTPSEQKRRAVSAKAKDNKNQVVSSQQSENNKVDSEKVSTGKVAVKPVQSKIAKTSKKKSKVHQSDVAEAVPKQKRVVRSSDSESRTKVPASSDDFSVSSAAKSDFYVDPENDFAPTAPDVEVAESINLPFSEQQNLQTAYAGEASVDDEEEFQYERPGPDYASMYVVQITPELAPLAKVGGLADVVTGLSRELEMRGHSVEIILPKYDCMRYSHVWGLCKTFEDLRVPWYEGQIHCTVWFGFVHDRKCFFIEPHSEDNFFNRGSIYGFDDDILRYAFFCRAGVEFLLQSGKHPDIIHCHDWQTALVPVFLYEVYQHMGMTHPRVCFTIHNFKHQGVTGDFLLNATGLHRPEYYFHHDRLHDNHIPNAINLMKGGIVYSNFVTTVSPRYAGETKDGGQGFGLESTLHTHHYKYGGIVNGIDYDTWNPEIDSHIPVQYNVDTVEKKYENKSALRNRLLLAECEKPIIAFVGRLDPQKGLDLVRHALFYSLNNSAQFIILGSSPESTINQYFWELKRHLNDSPDCHIEVGFDEDLAHLIYAGSDMMVVPSLFEPCGLTQLIAMHYGTIPIVRSVGGLADTVFDKDDAHDKSLDQRNGYVFKDYNDVGVESALSRAISCYYQFPEHFRELMKNAMRYDYSWKYAGQHYLNIYDYIREK